MRNIGFQTRTLTSGFLQNGQQTIDDRQVQTDPSINLWQGTVGLVKDSSVFGATSPIMGQRFRLDASPTLGTISYTGITADLRKYVMPIRPVTIAARVLHYGRYGSGSEDPRLIPLRGLSRSRPHTTRVVQRVGAGSRRTGAARCSTGCWAAGCSWAPRGCAPGSPQQAHLARSVVGAFFSAAAGTPISRIWLRSPVKYGWPLASAAGSSLKSLGQMDRPGKGAFFKFNLLTG